MLGVEQEGIKNAKEPIATIASPVRGTLPHLPTWGLPNGWDYWCRPWAYMDASHNCPDLKIQSVHKPPAAHVTIAVLVNCKRKTQYCPNLDVAKSAAAACTWRGKKGKVVDGNSNYNSSDVGSAQAAKKVLPQNFSGPNPAIEAIFKGWTAFHQNKTMWRPNPAMPGEDDTPSGCICTRPAEHLSKHRPYHTVGASLPRDPMWPPATEHVDTKKFPELEQSPNMGVGRIKGSKDAPQATTQGEPTFARPVDGKGVPRLKEGSSGPITTNTATPTMSTATYASAASSLNGHQHQQALVKVGQLSTEQLQAAQKATLPKTAGPASTPSTSASKQGQPPVEAMETDAEQSTQKDTSVKNSESTPTQRRSSHSASESRTQKNTSSSQMGTMASASQGSKSQPTKSGTAQMQQALKKAGSLENPRLGLGPITKHPDTMGKRAIDYRQEAFPAPTLRVVQPGGRDLKEAPLTPRERWVANTRATQAEVMIHLRALAQGGRQHAEYRDHSHWLWDWDDHLQQLKASQEALKRLQEEETHVDETHAGTILATIYALQTK